MTVAALGTFSALLIKPKRVYAAWPKASFDITDLGWISGAVSFSSKNKLKTLAIPNWGFCITIPFLPFNILDSVTMTAEALVFFKYLL